MKFPITFILFILLALAALLTPTTASSDLTQLEQSCASITTGCNDCYDATGCHFCEFDNQCHAIGSWYGCAYGATCQPPQCLRHAPEFRGYDKLSARFIFAALAAALFLFVVLIVLLQYCFFGCYYFKLCLGKQPRQTESGVPAAIVISPSHRPTYIVAHHYTNNNSSDPADIAGAINSNNSGNRQQYTELIDNDYIPPPQITSVHSTDDNA